MKDRKDYWRIKNEIASYVSSLLLPCNPMIKMREMRDYMRLTQEKTGKLSNASPKKRKEIKKRLSSPVEALICGS